MTLPAHPLANIFPLIEGVEFDELCASIKTNGLRDPIIVHDGMVLDGRNRQRACDTVGADCIYQPFPADDDPLQFVIDKNLKRRHLNESQRAMVAARLGRLSQGARSDLSPIGEKSQAERAAIMNVGKRSVERADDVVDKATPEIQHAVDQGKLAVSAAAQAAELDPETQRKIAAEAEASRANVARNIIKRERRDDRELRLAEKQHALPTKRYGVIVADPEWRFEPWSRNSGMDRAADNHYPTSCTEVIAARDVASIAADDCVLFLWATAPMLPHALLVMAAWGFDYVSNYVWAKDKIGTGYWNRNQHEHLLVGTRGKIPAPAMGTQWSSLQQAPLGSHSAKPECFLEMIERYFPTLPKIELNRRGPARVGWDAWGNEAQPSSANGAPLSFDESTGEIRESDSRTSDDDSFDVPAFLRRNPDNTVPQT